MDAAAVVGDTKLLTADDLQRAPLFGIFSDLYSDGLPRTSWCDLYEGFNVNVYEESTSLAAYDIGAFLELARRTGGPVLDLACGTGRITLPLAADGHEVCGLDLSADMLALLRRKLLMCDRPTRDRVTLRHDDMTRFRLDRHVALAVLGATSICLLHTAVERRRLFSAVRHHLHPGGIFAFDYLDLDEDALRARPLRLHHLAPPTGRRGRQFTLVGQLFLVDDRVELVNSYTETIDASGRTDRHLASTAKAMLRRADLLQELTTAGLRVLDDYEIALDEPFADARPRILVCAAASSEGRLDAAGTPSVALDGDPSGDRDTAEGGPAPRTSAGEEVNTHGH